MNVLAHEASEVLAFTSNLWKKQGIRFAPGNIFSQEESSSTACIPTMPCHAHLISPTNRKRAKPTLNEFRVLVKLWKHGMVDGDAEFVANRYSPSALFSCDDITVRGREAIQDYYENNFFPKYHPKDIKVLFGKVAVYGEQVHDNGIYDITTRSGQFLRMKYTFVYARDYTTGRWRIVHHKTAKVLDICTTRTPNDYHATHTQIVRLEDDGENTDDSDDESFEGEVSTHSTLFSDIIPWGSFPFENGYDDSEHSVTGEKVAVKSCHSSVDRATGVEERHDVPTKESGWNQTITTTNATTREQPDQDSAHKRRPSEVHRLVALLTGTNSIDNPVVLKINSDDLEQEEATNTTEDLPERRPSQVDHLVCLLTGTKMVTQKDLILLSVKSKKKELGTDAAITGSSHSRMRAQ